MGSKYYDAKKAHEYYEKHKKLKNRQSTKGFSDDQKKQWTYAKSELSKDRKKEMSKITQSTKNKRQAITESAKLAIQQLRERIKTMSPEDKAVLKEHIQVMIQQIRDKSNADKVALTKSAKQKRESTNSKYKKKQQKVYEHIKGGR